MDVSLGWDPWKIQERQNHIWTKLYRGVGDSEEGVGAHLFKIGISSALSRYPRFPDSILTMFFIFTNLYILQVQIYGLFQLYFVVNLILAAL